MSCITQLLDHCDHDFLAQPPSKEDAEAEESARFYIYLLEQAGRGEALVFALEASVEFIRKAAGRRGVISTSLRDDLLRSLMRAHLAAVDGLPASHSRADLARGVHALAGLVVRWAEPLEVRAQRDKLIVDELFAYSKMLLNDLNTMRLCQDLERCRARDEDSSEMDVTLYGCRL